MKQNEPARKLIEIAPDPITGASRTPFRTDVIGPYRAEQERLRRKAEAEAGERLEAENIHADMAGANTG